MNRLTPIFTTQLASAPGEGLPLPGQHDKKTVHPSNSEKVFSMHSPFFQGETVAPSIAAGSVSCREI
ncbi:hypothetical protein ACX1C1_09210 [Paenibacillus sp. strain BS8-2]